MSAPLRVSYSTREELRQHFDSQIALGGLFIPTVTNLSFRDDVRVVFDLRFCDDRVELDAEVVSVIEPELAAKGSEPGVAIQFRDPPEKIHETLAQYIGVPKGPDRRRAPRRVVRVPILLRTPDGLSVSGRTRDLSHSGVLASIDGPPVRVGRPVEVTLEHPTFDERLIAPGRVVRHLEVEGTVTAVACSIDLPATKEREGLQFIDDVQASEHARRLRGVTGAIGELGIVNVIQVFGGCTRSGTLTVLRGYEEGRIVFEGGLLREARLGPVAGLKALSRIVAWREGSFEFQARVESGFGAAQPCALDAALLEATRQQDELARLASARWAQGTRFEVDREKLDAERSSLSKLEDASIELALSGMSLRALLDVIPEPDLEIHAALDTLADLGLIHTKD